MKRSKSLTKWEQLFQFPLIAIRYSVPMFLAKTKLRRSHPAPPLNYSSSIALRNTKR